MLALFFSSAFCAQAQDAPATPPDQSATPAPNPSTAPRQETKSAEVETRDTPATFKVRVNLVLVRVVVRDQQGKVIENLHREDFALADDRKPQVISFFNVETPASRAMPVTTSESHDSEMVAAATPPAAVPAIPQRFVSILYDDVHISMEDSVNVRAATARILGSIAPTDRVGVFTTSGQLTQEFTSDQELLLRAMNGIIPRSMTGGFGGVPSCPDISYYQADLIENKSDQQAFQVAVAETVDCAFGGDQSKISLARPMAQAAVQTALSNGDAESLYAYRHVEDAMRRLAGMPGQRVLVFVSPGFILSTLFTDASGRD